MTKRNDSPTRLLAFKKKKKTQAVFLADILHAVYLL